MKKLNLYSWLGLIFITTWFVSNKLNLLNENIHGVFISIGFSLILLGILTQSYDILYFRDSKNKFFDRFFRKNKKRQRKI